MTSMPAWQRAMAAVLATAYLFDLVDARGEIAAAPLAMFGAVWVATRRPALGVGLGAVAVVLSSLYLSLTAYAGPYPPLVSEVASGCALVVLVWWRGSRPTAVAATAGLTLAAAGAVVLRGIEAMSARYAAVVGATGLLALGTAIALGEYLRRVDARAFGPDLRAFLRGQWPVAAAMGALVLIDFGSFADRYSPFAGLTSLIPIGMAVVNAGCAVMAPRAPTRYAVIAAGVTAGTAAVLLVVRAVLGGTPNPVTVTTVAAHLALIAYIIRYAERGRMAFAIGVLIGADLLAAGMLQRLAGTRELLLLAVLLLVVAAAIGQYFRSRDRDRDRVMSAAVTAAQQAERMALARDLHDVVAHHVTGIVIQAQAARLVADERPAVAADALDRIETAGVEALAAMRRLVGSMRGAAPAGASGRATTDLAADLRALGGRFTGPPIDVVAHLPPHLPPDTGRSVLRIVQEALTNVTKHAATADEVTVRIDVIDRDLHVVIADDAPSPVEVRPGGSGGYGLIGMRERVDLLGGELTVGPTGDRGWTVHAVLPLQEENR